MVVEIKLDKRALRKKGYPIVLYVYNSAKDKEIKSLGYYSFEKDWNENKNEPKQSNPQFNAIIEKIYQINLKKLNVHRKNHLSSKQVVRYLLGESDSIYIFWEEWIKELKKKKKSPSGGNAKFYEDNLKQWKNFKDPINYDEINYNLLNQFKVFKSDISPGGRNTYLKAVRAVYNEAIRRGYYTPETYISPFSKIMEKVPKTKDKYLTLEEMKKMYENPSDHLFYKIFMLSFYLGGLDYVDLYSLKKTHIKNGRVKFVRFKGGTDEVMDNFIFEQAKEIIENFTEEKHLTPLHNYVYKPYRQKYVSWIRKYLKSLEIESYVDSKTPRYTFINLGKQLFLNRDVVMEITGHSRGDVHSIYEGGFPDEVQDEVHKKIIDSIRPVED